MEDKEFTVTIPTEDYKELIQAQNELDNLINYIFGLCDLEENGLTLDEQSVYLLIVYLKNIWSFSYNKTLINLQTKQRNREDKIGEE